jgi:hypothetical protein
VAAALIAALFAMRTAAAQRALDREKLTTARRDAELAELRSTISNYRRSQVLPFLEALDRTMVASYAVAHFPPYFPELGSYIPQLRRHADGVLREWANAMEDMSRRRMQVLLAINRDRIAVIADRLVEFVNGMNSLIETRDAVWFKRASPAKLWEVQREYIGAGYYLMTEIRDAALMAPEYEPPLSDEAKKRLAAQLTIPLERASVVGVPYGSTKDFSWIGIWVTQTAAEWRTFIERATHTTHDEFEKNLKELTLQLYNTPGMLDVQMVRVKPEGLEVTCIAVKLPSKDRLEEFARTHLPEHRGKHTVLWSSHRAPIEFTVGLDDELEHGSREKPHSPVERRGGEE